MLRELKDVVQHGAGAAKPERDDWTVDQRWDRYTPAEHAVWKILFERQSALLPGRAIRRRPPRATASSPAEPAATRRAAE